MPNTPKWAAQTSPRSQHPDLLPPVSSALKKGGKRLSSSLTRHKRASGWREWSRSWVTTTDSLFRALIVCPFRHTYRNSCQSTVTWPRVIKKGQGMLLKIGFVFMYDHTIPFFSLNSNRPFPFILMPINLKCGDTFDQKGSQEIGKLGRSASFFPPLHYITPVRCTQLRRVCRKARVPLAEANQDHAPSSDEVVNALKQEDAPLRVVNDVNT